MPNGVSSSDGFISDCEGVRAEDERSSSLHCLAEVAQKLHTMLHAADVLTERHHLSELDRMTLDGLLIAGRDYASELLWRIEKLSQSDKQADSPRHS